MAEVNFKRILKNKLPSTKTDGSFYVVVDSADSEKGELHVDMPSGKRIKIGGGAEVYVSNTTPPENLQIVGQLWIDTSKTTNGILRWWNGNSWVAMSSIWTSENSLTT